MFGRDVIKKQAPQRDDWKAGDNVNVEVSGWPARYPARLTEVE
jgi:hypothetical protein